MSEQEYIVRAAQSAEAPTILDLWRGERSTHATTPDRPEDVHRLSEHRRRGVGLALVRAGEEHLRQRDARRITALVWYEDEIASAFWESAGYPRDRQIGRRVRNL